MTIDLNEQQVEFLKELLGDLFSSEDYGNTSKAIANQIIIKLEEE